MTNHNLFNYIEGNKDLQYGGIITNICNLSVGTTFFVRNGCWTGTICEDKNGLYVHIDGCKPYRFKRGDTYLLSIDILKKSKKSEIHETNNELIIKDVINICSVCKNKSTKICEQCETNKGTIIPNKFLADVSKITPYFVDSYYELLNKYIQLLHDYGFKTKLETFDLGE